MNSIELKGENSETKFKKVEKVWHFATLEEIDDWSWAERRIDDWKRRSNA